MAAAVLLLAGCGDDTIRGGKAKTRPIELFDTAPAGYRFEAPDPATRKRVRALITKQAPISGDDLAVRQVFERRGKQPVAIAVVVDAHAEGKPGDAVDGFAERAKEMGTTATRVQVAGTEAGFARLQGVEAAVAGKNGYVVESIAAERATARLVLARLIFAARDAER